MQPSASSTAVVDHDTPPLRLVVIDDHRSYAEAVSMALSRNGGIGNVRPFFSFHDAMATIHIDAPDVVLLDWQLPDVDGAEAIRAIRAVRPTTAVVLISGHTDAALTRTAMRAGAAFVLPKESSVGEIVDALRRSANGEVQTETLADSASERISLSPREAEVLGMLSIGKDVPQIARELFLSVHTVRGYVKDLRVKFGARTQLELVANARRRGSLPG